MSESSAPPPRETPSKPAPRALSREERLAAKLRENLRRRKGQARALERGDETLSKPPEGS